MEADVFLSSVAPISLLQQHGPVEADRQIDRGAWRGQPLCCDYLPAQGTLEHRTSCMGRFYIGLEMPTNPYIALFPRPLLSQLLRVSVVQ